MAIGGGDWPAQPLCKLHLVLFTRAIAERLEQSDAYAAKRRARQRELERIENLHQRKLTQRSVKRRITGFVYFARRGPNVKIGFSSSPPKRLRDLEMAAGQPFDEVVTMRGNRALEQRYHRRFQEHRVQGEWFRFVDEIRLEMYRLQSKAS